MNVFIRFHNGEDLVVEDVYSTKTKNHYFMCLDEEDDKQFIAHEHNILYVEYKY